MRCLSILLLVSLPVAAQEATPDQVQRAQVERLRGELTNHLQLRAYDLVDELVHSWIESPPFANATPLVMADIVAPMGFGSGLEALIENHLAQRLLQHPETGAELVHCPACTALMVHAEQTGTIVARGVDQPGALVKLTGAGKHALFLDFEGEGAELILRVRITALDDRLSIVYARTLSTRTSSSALLRSSERLVSAEDARTDYVDQLAQRSSFSLPLRLSLVQFAPPEDSTTLTSIPLPWLQIGAEMPVSSKRAWLGSLMVGGMLIPDVHTGFMVQARGARLISGQATSLTHPDVYVFLGVALTALQGTTALVLRDDQPTVTDIIAAASGIVSPTTNYATIQSGVEMRVNNRVGASFLLETAPTLDGSPSIGRFFELFFIPIHAMGFELSFIF